VRKIHLAGMMASNLQLIVVSRVVASKTGNPGKQDAIMKFKAKLKRILGWVVRGAAVVAVPALFPASVGMGERVGWAGAVLLWLYMGKVMKQDTRVEE
jgi:hypothetical protein